MNPAVTVYIFWIWILCGLIGAAVGLSKNLGAPGFALGFLLGPLGILIVILLDGNRKPCPFCLEKMKRRARVCPHCQNQVSAQAAVHRSGGLVSVVLPLMAVAAIVGSVALWLHPAWVR